MIVATFLLGSLLAAGSDVETRVGRVLQASPVFDGHNDLAWKIREQHGGRLDTVDLTRDTSTLPFPLQTDIPRLFKGHVGAQFWSTLVPTTFTGPRVVEMTLEQIDLVRRIVAANPSAFELATTAADIRRIQKDKRIAALLSIEGGHQIDGRLAVLRQYRVLGVTSMTLVHSASSDWADSATDAARSNGLSAFGKQVVGEMNRIGMVIDVSHASDETTRAVLATSKAPIIASHSGARAVAAAPRNLPDDLLRSIAQAGGVVMVNFWPGFVSAAWATWDRSRSEYARSVGVPSDVYGRRAPAPLVAWEANHPQPEIPVTAVGDHVDHIARVAGHDAVGIGASYDNLQHLGPTGMGGVDAYPLLFAELARRGWSDADLARLAEGNMLRVLERVETVAASQAGVAPVDGGERSAR